MNKTKEALSEVSRVTASLALEGMYLDKNFVDCLTEVAGTDFNDDDFVKKIIAGQI